MQFSTLHKSDLDLERYPIVGIWGGLRASHGLLRPREFEFNWFERDISYHAIVARTHDGVTVWRGIFTTEAAAREFFYLLTVERHVPPDYWRSPVPAWVPGMEDVPGLVYEFVDYVSLTNVSASNQTHTLSTYFNSGNNFVELASGGGVGAASAAGYQSGGGGGSGGYCSVANLGLAPGNVITYFNNTGGACWYNGTTLAGSSVGANAGTGATTAAGGAGASLTGAIGTTKKAGQVGGTGFSPGTGGGGGGGGTPGPGGAGTAGKPGSSISGGGTAAADATTWHDSVTVSGAGNQGGGTASVGFNGNNPGGGAGGGGWDGTTARAGGAASKGTILISNTRVTGGIGAISREKLRRMN